MTLSNVQPIYRSSITLNDPEKYPPPWDNPPADIDLAEWTAYWNDIQTLRNLEEGVYLIDETIKLPWVYGTTIRGVGSAHYYGLHGGGVYAGYTTNLLWDGIKDRGVNLEPPDETKTGAMFWITGESTQIEKVTIGNAPIGILLNKEKPGIGTGKVIMRDCYFNGCKTAFETGPYNGNNDEVTFDNVTANGCETLLRLKNNQSMVFRIRSCFVKNGKKNISGQDSPGQGLASQYGGGDVGEVEVKDIIDVRAGGIVYVEDMTVIHADSVLKFNPDLDGTITEALEDDALGKRIGSSNGYYSLKNIKFDQQAGTPMVVDMAEHFSVRIIVENVQAPQKNWRAAIDDPDREPALMYNLKGKMAITIRDCNLFEGCIAWEDGRSVQDRKTWTQNHEYCPHIKLDHCNFRGTNILDVLSKIKSKGRCYLTAKDCYANSWGKYNITYPIPDVTGYFDA